MEGVTINAQSLPPSLLPLDADRLGRLAAYAHLFRDVVSRADQRERLGLYLRGLLDGAEPKNAEAIAGRWAGGAGGSGMAQALQHFLGSSPWDAGQFLACYRSQLPEARRDQLRIWVVQDVVFPKKGHHSVGTQRQLARPVGRKINCQVAVTVSEFRPDGFFPLAIRLYLPGYWLREHRDAAERLVPAEHRNQLSKAAVALRLIDELRGEGRAVEFLTADGGFLSSHDFTEEVARRQMQVLHPGDVTPPIADGVSSPDEMTSGSRAEREAKAALLARLSLAETDRGFDWLRSHLGLDQFEGRNWLGWHHHTALVLAAYGFLVWERPGVGNPPLPSGLCACEAT